MKSKITEIHIDSDKNFKVSLNKKTQRIEMIFKDSKTKQIIKISVSDPYYKDECKFFNHLTSILELGEICDK